MQFELLSLIGGYFLHRSMYVVLNLEVSKGAPSEHGAVVNEGCAIISICLDLLDHLRLLLLANLHTRCLELHLNSFVLMQDADTLPSLAVETLTKAEDLAKGIEHHSMVVTALYLDEVYLAGFHETQPIN